jgi:hypothetical protein
MRKLLLALATCSLALATCSLALSTPAWAKNDKHRHEESAQTPASKPTGKEPWLKYTFSDKERDILKHYYGDQPAKKQKPLPPGLKKKLERGGELPPGWQKKVARGEVLESDVLKYADKLPPELIGRLPPQQPGTAIIKVEGKLVKIWEATRAIIDLFDL